MIQAFTICANNYLAHAKILATSFKAFHPDIDFSIVVLDKPNATIDYSDLGADNILWAHNILAELVNELCDVYGIAELCTVIKPQFIKYFYDLGADTVLYIDPDIQVFSEFTEVFDAIKSYDVVLTPHICSPTGEVGHPLDKDLMRTGIYNLGFLAIKNTQQTQDFISWWHKRVVAYGFHDLSKGFFYDQIWLMYAPAFLDKVYILRHLGYNIANWNLHERQLLEKSGCYYVNTQDVPLRFFHFSHFKIAGLPEIASYNKNYNLENRDDILSIFMNYKQGLESYDYHRLKKIAYTYGKKPVSTMRPRKANRIKRAWWLLKKSLKVIIKG